MLAATSSRELCFHFVDRHDLEPIGYDKVRKDTGEHGGSDDVVRAFELEKGRFVPIEPVDLDRLDVELTHSIDICDFVSLDEIDPICTSRVPAAAGGRPRARNHVLRRRGAAEAEVVEERVGNARVREPRARWRSRSSRTSAPGSSRSATTTPSAPSCST
jgi:hypothetical protein